VLPYSQQHVYWWVIGPPLLLPLYFHYENLRYVVGNAVFGGSGMWKDSYATSRYMAKGRNLCVYMKHTIYIYIYIMWKDSHANSRCMVIIIIIIIK